MIPFVLALLQTTLASPPPADMDRPVEPVTQSTISDQELEQLATRESRLPGRLYSVIYDDPSMRAEIRRVGFEKGCRAIAGSKRQVSLQFVPALVPATIAAIRNVVPEPLLSEMRFRSFIAGPMRAYARRIDAEIDRTASGTLTKAYDAMRTAFLQRTRQLPATQNPGDNIVTPRPDIAKAIGIHGPYNLDNPAHLGMACADMLISTDQRPEITISPAPDAFPLSTPRR